MNGESFRFRESMGKKGDRSAMAPFWVANSLVLITPASAGRNFLSYRQGEPRAARICGVPPAEAVYVARPGSEPELNVVVRPVTMIVAWPVKRGCHP